MENKGCPCRLRNSGWPKPSRDSCRQACNNYQDKANTVTVLKEQLRGGTGTSNIPGALALLKFIMQK